MRGGRAKVSFALTKLPQHEPVMWPAISPGGEGENEREAAGLLENWLIY
jgi:hypothetical protein